MSKRLIVTIDGPSGAGKSTASKALAARLGYRYLDTGAMYRAFAFLVHLEQEKGGEADPESLIGDFQVRFTQQNGETRTFIDARDISEEISREVERFASEKHLPVHGRFPYDPAFTEAQLRGRSYASFASTKNVEMIRNLWKSITSAAKSRDRNGKRRFAV